MREKIIDNNFTLNYESLKKSYKNTILSVSGWRKRFNESEHAENGKISSEEKILVALMAYTISQFFKYINLEEKAINIAKDSRISSPIINKIISKICIKQNLKIRLLGTLPITQILSFTKVVESLGFIYISASHNPPEYNGLKFGLNDGGVLEAEITKTLINKLDDNFKNIKLIESLIELLKEDSEIMNQSYEDSLKKTAHYFNESLNIYKNFMEQISFNENLKERDDLKLKLRENPIGIVIDFNGSSRINSIDREMLRDFNIKLKSYNEELGIFKHEINPEGSALNFSLTLLEENFKEDKNFILGYVPDCDGDRGNLVFIDKNEAKPLEAQTVFALTALSELCYLYYNNIKKNIAIVVNDATSLNIREIAKYFNARVFTSEVGEANVTGLAEDKRREGFIVKILGEGSNGGSIIYPSKVRDPLSMILSIIKLLKIKELFKIWCNLSQNQYREDYTIRDILETIKFYKTTIVNDSNSSLKIIVKNHYKLKENYENLFLKMFNEKKDYLKKNFNIVSFEEVNYDGKFEIKGFGGEFRNRDARGGFKINLKDQNDNIILSYWMRASKTEDLFRLQAEIKYEYRKHLDEFFNIHKNLLLEANKA